MNKEKIEFVSNEYRQGLITKEEFVTKMRYWGASDIDTMKVMIHDLIQEYAHDKPEENIYGCQTDTEIMFSCINEAWERPGKYWTLLNKERIDYLVDRGIKDMLRKFGWVYVYICKDNRIVSIEGPPDEGLEEFKEHLEYCDEVIPELYYEGWD